MMQVRMQRLLNFMQRGKRQRSALLQELGQFEHLPAPVVLGLVSCFQYSESYFELVAWPGAGGGARRSTYD